MRSDNAAITAAYDELEAAQNNVAALSYDGLTHSELVALESRRETMRRREPAVDHRIINRLAAEASPVELGGTSLADVLATRLRISKGEARRRIRHAELFGPRQALTGEPLPPKLPKTADAQERGEIGAEHVRIIERFFHKLPHWVDYQTRDAAEADLARIAAGLGPVQLRQAADRLMALLNPDGSLTDAERARRRHLSIGRQQADGMSPISGLLDPETRATLDAVLAKWAAPGVCNPEDQAPCVDGTPSQAHIDADQRSQPQRNHDALQAMGRSVLASGELGKHSGPPCTIIVSPPCRNLNPISAMR